MKPELKEAILQLLDVVDSQHKSVLHTREALEYLKIQQSLKILRQQVRNNSPSKAKD